MFRFFKSDSFLPVRVCGLTLPYGILVPNGAEELSVWHCIKGKQCLYITNKTISLYPIYLIFLLCYNFKLRHFCDFFKLDRKRLDFIWIFQQKIAIHSPFSLSLSLIVFANFWNRTDLSDNICKRLPKNFEWCGYKIDRHCHFLKWSPMKLYFTM